jgi:hypothetical protein
MTDQLTNSQGLADMTAAEVLEQKMIDALTPGAVIELDPEEAEQLGAFHEDALTEAEAMESAADLLDPQER